MTRAGASGPQGERGAVGWACRLRAVASLIHQNIGLTEGERVGDERKLLQRLLSGSRNIRFREFQRLIEAFGFGFVRTRGSHHMYSHPGIPELLNIQDDGGQAKPYQVRQFLQLIERHRLLLPE